MTHGFAVLIGFVRPIPDVATFATPIFVDDAGNHLVQHEIGGCITAFQPVNVGEEFEAITFKIAVHVGDAALYSFEMRTGSVLIGPASLLGRTLTTRLLDATNADAKYSHTVAAVRRFVEFSRGAYSNLSSGFPCLIELTRQGAGEPFYLSHVLCGQPALGTRMYAEGELLDAFTPTRWETEIFNLLSSPHTPEPDSLDHTSQYIESLISQFPDRGLARTQFRESLDNVFRMWWPSRPKRLEGRLSLIHI